MIASRTRLAAVGLALGALAFTAGTVLAGLPTATGQPSVTTPRDVAKTITLTGTADAGAADFTVDTGPSHGGLDVSTGTMDCDTASPANCSADVLYTPGSGYEGPDSFTFNVHNPTDGTSGDATVSITVGSAPVAVDDPGASCGDTSSTGGAFLIPEDWPGPFAFIGSCGVLGNDTDADGDTLTWSIAGDASHGTLTKLGETSFAYQPDPNFSTLAGDQPGGTWTSDSFTYEASDGVLQSNTGTMRFWVAPINDPPTFTAGPTVSVGENSGAHSAAWATNISPGPANESDQTVHFVITNVDLTGVPNLFSVAPAIADDGTLTFTPGTDQVGLAHVTVHAQDDGGLEDYGITYPGLPKPDDTSADVVFDIVVNAVNQAPSFTAGTGPTVNEDSGAASISSWATSISPGPTNESSQTVSFQVTSDSNPTLFSVAPAISSSGTLTFTPAANRNGVANLTVVAKDNGGTANGGVDTSAGQSLTITVTAVNDVPSFTAGSGPTVNEDSGAASLATWATAISAGPNEGSQTVNFVLFSDDNAGLFSVAPAVSASGTLSFTPAANANGVAHVAFKIHDNGGTANGGVDTSASQSVTITVTAVNDAPSYTSGSGPTVNEDSGAASIPSWATAISVGPANEVGQTVTFQVTSNSNPNLFSVAPAVSSTGTLTFTPGANRNGVATLTVVAKDNGGTALGGVDTSAGHSLTITVTAVNDPPNPSADTVNIAENAPATVINVLANDNSLPDGPEVLIITAVSAPAHGTVTIAAGGGSVSYRPTTGYYGADFFTYTIQDPGLLTATSHVDVNVVKDVTPPTVTLPVQHIRTITTLTSTGLSGQMTWSGADAGVGLLRFDLQRSVNGGAFATLTLPSPTATALNLPFTIGGHYQFRVRSVDKNGNASAWFTGPIFTAARYQETSGYITYGGSWSLTSNVNDSGGAAKYTSTAGRSASFTHVMRDVAFVGPRSSTRGSVDIYVDGVKVAAVSMNTTTTIYRQVIWQMHFSKIGTHTIKVVVRGNGRFDLDCFVILT